MQQPKEEQNNHTDDSVPAGAEDNTAAGVEELRKNLDDALKAAESSRDQMLRKAAEFENYKRRRESEYINVIRNANEALLLSLLPVVSDFRRSLKAGRETLQDAPFYAGIELIFQKLIKTLEGQGVRPFDSVGKPFDVQYHDALLQVPHSDVPPNTVVEEIEQGFMLNEKVLRHAKVVVSSGSPAQHQPGDSGNDSNEPVKH